MQRSLLKMVGAILAALTTTAHAQYPNKPIKLIVPFQAGSAPDVIGRAVADRLAVGFGQPVVVDNRAGAGGNIGAEALARSAPDGYTLMLATISHASNPSLYRSVNYEPLRDFMPVSMLARVPGLLVVPANSPIHSIAELIAEAKAKPGVLNYASGGNGSQAHFAGEMFRQAADIEVTHIPYKGAPEVLTSLLSNQTAFAFPTFNTALPQVQSGKLRALGVTSPTRNPKLPGVPTMMEAMPNGFELNAWFGVFVPAGTPKDIVARIHAEIIRGWNDQATRERLGADGTDLTATNPEEAARILKADVSRWAAIIRRIGARVD